MWLRFGTIDIECKDMRTALGAAKELLLDDPTNRNRIEITQKKQCNHESSLSIGDTPYGDFRCEQCGERIRYLRIENNKYEDPIIIPESN